MSDLNILYTSYIHFCKWRHDDRLLTCQFLTSTSRIRIPMRQGGCAVESRCH